MTMYVLEAGNRKIRVKTEGRQGESLMELKVVGDRFYVLEVGGEKWVHDTMESSVQTLRESVQADDDLDSDSIRIVEVNILKRKWKIQEVPWVTIVIDLIRGGTAVKGKSN